MILLRCLVPKSVWRTLEIVEGNWVGALTACVGKPRPVDAISPAI